MRNRALHISRTAWHIRVTREIHLTKSLTRLSNCEQTSTASAFHRVLTLATARIFLALTILLASANTGYLKAAVTGGTPVEANADGVRTLIALSASSASSGHKLGVEVSLEVAPGWHIYGAPLPEGESLTPTSIKFDSDLLARQTINLPQAPLHFELLNQTYIRFTPGP